MNIYKVLLRCGIGFSAFASQQFAMAAAPLEVLVKKKIAGSEGELKVPVGKTVKINEVTPSASFMQGFEAKAFQKIVRQVCDKDVQRLGIRSIEAELAEIVWTRKVSNRPEYKAIVENHKGQLTISCEAFQEEAG